jgi:hypothetical protein
MHVMTCPVYLTFAELTKRVTVLHVCPFNHEWRTFMEVGLLCKARTLLYLGQQSC